MEPLKTEAIYLFVTPIMVKEILAEMGVAGTARDKSAELNKYIANTLIKGSVLYRTFFTIKKQNNAVF